MGPLSFNFIVKLVMSSIYSMRLEKTCFYKKSADYAWMLLLGITWIVVHRTFHTFIPRPFLASTLHRAF